MVHYNTLCIAYKMVDVLTGLHHECRGKDAAVSILSEQINFERYKT
jgi:hypothetical protein